MIGGFGDSFSRPLNVCNVVLFLTTLYLYCRPGTKFQVIGSLSHLIRFVFRLTELSYKRTSLSLLGLPLNWLRTAILGRFWDPSHCFGSSL